MESNSGRESEDYSETNRDEASSQYDAPTPETLGLDQIPRIVNPRAITSRSRRRPITVSIPEPTPEVNRRRRAGLSSMDPVRRAGAHLRGDASSLLTSENPSPSFSGPSFSEAPTERRRVKRRKLDSEDKREGIRGFNYGHYGQVVSVPLEMEIATCDGDNSRNKILAQNMLLNDCSVYNSETNRCNIILRHRGEIPFCLKKLVIRTPTSGLDPPYVTPCNIILSFDILKNDILY